MKRALALAAATVVAVVLVAELVALPVATRVATDLAGRCLELDDVEVTAIDRPATLRLLTGRTTGVEVQAHGIRVDGLRIERADIQVAEVGLPWAVRDLDSIEVAARLVVVEDDLVSWLESLAPRGIRPAAELSPGLVSVGIEPLRARLDLEVEVVDGRLRLVPAGGLPAWFASLGIDLELELPDELQVEHVELEEGQVQAIVAVEQRLGDGGAGAAGCPGGER